MRRMALVAMFTLLALSLSAREGKSGRSDTSITVASKANAETDPAEGEKRYRINCGRCHMAPHKFPPRMMATIIRHMRVRAMLTDEDMRYILKYMTQ